MINKEQIRNLLSGKPSTFMEAISESLSDKAESNVLEETRAIAINLLEMTPGHKKMVGDALKDKTIADTGADETKPTTPKTAVNGAAGGNANGKTARPANPSKDDNRDDYNQLNDFDSKSKNIKKNFVGKNYTTNERALRSESLNENSALDYLDYLRKKAGAKPGQWSSHDVFHNGKWHSVSTNGTAANMGINGRAQTLSRESMRKALSDAAGKDENYQKYATTGKMNEAESLDEAGNALNKLKKNAAITMMGKFRDRSNVESGPQIIDRAKKVGGAGYTKKGEFEKKSAKNWTDLVGKDAVKTGRGANRFNQRTYSAFIGKTKVVNDTSNVGELNDKINGIKTKGMKPTLHVESAEYSEDGRGKYKVNYVHPDKKNIGNDRFETKPEAVRFANSLKKKGYHDVHLGEEKINELSKNTLHSYADKAMIDQKKRARKWIATGDQNELRKFDNRSGGITHAYFNRFTKG